MFGKACSLVAGAPQVSHILVNDIQSQLNSTLVHSVVSPRSIDALQEVIHHARAAGRSISIAGGRHAMGGQQFGTGTILVDMRKMNRVVNFDSDKPEIEVEAGIEWPELIDYLIQVQDDRQQQWGIITKQTGTDRLSIGGALAANIHGRSLRSKPIIDDVESFLLIDTEGDARKCSRTENADLFRLAIGGYGLFGIIATVTLRLAPRRKLERVVKIIEIENLMPAFEARIADGFLFGDFQYVTDENSEHFLKKGVFACYRPADEKTPPTESHKELSVEDWKRLIYLSHADKRHAYDFYSSYYLSTSGQVYWSDTHQLSVYIEDYHDALDRQLGAREKGTEVLTEIFVPRVTLAPFMEDIRKDFRENQVNVIYGTIRLIEKDDESFLAWAREPYACVTFNLHTVHTPDGLEKTAGDCRRLIDRGIQHGGSYYLTYHRWATCRQVEACYPQFSDFLRLKRKYDPEERFQSDWYRHHTNMFRQTRRAKGVAR